MRILEKPNDALWNTARSSVYMNRAIDPGQHANANMNTEMGQQMRQREADGETQTLIHGTGGQRTTMQ
jgi:hypothetical protein